MKLKNIMASASRVMNKAVFSTKKHSPEILLATGLVGMAATVVAACYATTKATAIMQEADEQRKDTEIVLDTKPEEYSEEDQKKDLQIIHVQTGVKLVKTYAPALALGALSVASILASHNIIHKRNIALAAACTAVSTDFKAYRKGVVERFGEEVDRELKHGIKAEKFVETVVDPETGEEKVVETERKVVDPNLSSPYAFYYDSSSPNWETNMDYNLMYAKSQQFYLNQRYNAFPSVFLNEVRDLFDAPRTTAGQVVGWKKGGKGDGYIDLRYEVVDRVNPDGSVESVIVMDPNVDGPILTDI